MNSFDARHPSSRTFGFVFLVWGVVAVLSWSDLEWKWGDHVLVSWPNWQGATSADSQPFVEPEDVEELFAAYQIETELLKDDLEADDADWEMPALASWITAKSGLDGNPNPAAALDSPYPLNAAERASESSGPVGLHPNLWFHGDSIAFQNLWSFFANARGRVGKAGQALHVLHFGDSQIEGDRITSELRQSFQKRWGGSGPGYFSAVPQAQIPAFVQTADNWTRHTLFGRVDSTLGHERYGLLLTAGTYQPIKETGWSPPISFRKRNMGYPNNRKWEGLHVLATSSNSDSLPVRVSCDSTQYLAWLSGNSVIQSLHATLPESFQEMTLEFGANGADINAIGFFSDEGIIVHNIPMRGSSGTIFRKADRDHWTQQLQSLDIGMVLLQFGGNTVPYIQSEAESEQYARWLASQVKLFKATLPDVPIVLIGPSDMSMKSGLDFTTYPYLQAVKQSLQQMAEAEHILFWDLFEVMGGANSMPAWVKAEPALAAADHIHFTNRGARRIGALLAEAFQAEYEMWRTGLSASLPDSTQSHSAVP